MSSPPHLRNGKNQKIEKSKDMAKDTAAGFLRSKNEVTTLLKLFLSNLLFDSVVVSVTLSLLTLVDWLFALLCLLQKWLQLARAQWPLVGNCVVPVLSFNGGKWVRCKINRNVYTWGVRTRLRKRGRQLEKWSILGKSKSLNFVRRFRSVPSFLTLLLSVGHVIEICNVLWVEPA